MVYKLKLTKKWIVTITITILVFMAGIYIGFRDKSPGEQRVSPVNDEPKLELSAWVVDWQWKSGIDDLRSISKGLSSVQLFATYFDDNGHLWFSEKMIETWPILRDTMKESGGGDVVLTLVNDRIQQGGSEIQKDSALITRLMATEQSRSQHIHEIMDVVIQYDFDGVEIDYEKIKDSDWDHVISFYTELYQRLEAKGKSLRIVLESRMPIERLALSEGPIYVMMAYNLYGTHSGPGPKADRELISKLATRMDHLPGENIMALSAGGFDWAEQGKVTAVTEKRAAELSLESVRTPKRDEASGSIYFDYIDDDHVKHTVWYADEVTISEWMMTSRMQGYPKIAIWRLGELGEGTLQKLNSYHNVSPANG